MVKLSIVALLVVTASPLASQTPAESQRMQVEAMRALPKFNGMILDTTQSESLRGHSDHAKALASVAGAIAGKPSSLTVGQRFLRVGEFQVANSNAATVLVAVMEMRKQGDAEIVAVASSGYLVRFNKVRGQWAYASYNPMRF